MLLLCSSSLNASYEGYCHFITPFNAYSKLCEARLMATCSRMICVLKYAVLYSSSRQIALRSTSLYALQSHSYARIYQIAFLSGAGAPKGCIFTHGFDRHPFLLRQGATRKICQKVVQVQQLLLQASTSSASSALARYFHATRTAEKPCSTYSPIARCQTTASTTMRAKTTNHSFPEK